MKKTDKKSDLILSRIFSILSISIIIYWLYRFFRWFVGWFESKLPYDSSWWVSIGKFIIDNFSIFLAVYFIICMQVSGIAEFKYKKNFLKAFLLSLFLTPPLMMVIYGRK